MYGLHLLGLIIVLVSSKPLTRPFSSEKTFGKYANLTYNFIYFLVRLEFLHVLFVYIHRHIADYTLVRDPTRAVKYDILAIV